MNSIYLQIIGIVSFVAIILLISFFIVRNIKIRKKLNHTASPEVDDYEQLLSSSFYKSFSKDYKGAIEEINKALKVKPHLERLYFQRAKFKEEMKDYAGAKGDYTKAILLKSDYDVAYLNRGLLKIKTEDYTGARKDLDKAIALNSSLKEAHFFKREAELKVADIRDYQKKQNVSPKIEGDSSQIQGQAL